jgi:hypothetical protein
MSFATTGPLIYYKISNSSCLDMDKTYGSPGVFHMLSKVPSVKVPFDLAQAAWKGFCCCCCCCCSAEETIMLELVAERQHVVHVGGSLERWCLTQDHPIESDPQRKVFDW